MRATKRTIRALVAALSVVFLLPEVASACSCAETTTAEDVERAGIVVRGIFESIEMPNEAGRNAGNPAVYTLRPTHLWKGDVVGTFTVATAPDGAACGLEGFREGSDVVLFATDYGDGDGLTADLCGGTAAADGELVDEVSAILGEGEPMSVAPEPPVSESAPTEPAPDRGDTANWVGPAITTAAAVLLAGSLVALWRLWPRKRS